MTTKTRYVLPVFAAMFAMFFVTASPNVFAEVLDGTSSEQHYKPMHKRHMPILVEGFEGSLPITTGTNKEELKEQVTVSLSEAADNLEVYRARLGVAINENDDKFLVWVLVNVEKNASSNTSTVTIYIVDAGDATNTAQIVKEFDHSEKKRIQSLPGMVKNIEQIEQRFADTAGNLEINQLRAQFVEKIHELKEVHENEDSDRVQELRQELQELKQQFIGARGS